MNGKADHQQHNVLLEAEWNGSGKGGALEARASTRKSSQADLYRANLSENESGMNGETRVQPLICIQRRSLLLPWRALLHPLSPLGLTAASRPAARASRRRRRRRRRSGGRRSIVGADVEAPPSPGLA